MLKKGSSSKKTINPQNLQIPLKSAISSIHLKSSQDTYSQFYRLPLKQILEQRKQQQNNPFTIQLKSKTSIKIDPPTRTSKIYRRESNGKSSKKISISQAQQSSRNLRTDRSSKDFVMKRERTTQLKRLNTYEDEIKNEDENIRHIKQMHEQNRILKEQLNKKKKDHVQIRIVDMMKLVNEYVRLCNKNGQMQRQLNFYRNQISCSSSQQNNYVFKALK